jgi:hypothetical protein
VKWNVDLEMLWLFIFANAEFKFSIDWLNYVGLYLYSIFFHVKYKLLNVCILMKNDFINIIVHELKNKCLKIIYYLSRLEMFPSYKVN